MLRSFIYGMVLNLNSVVDRYNRDSMFENIQIKLSQLTRMSTFTFYVRSLRPVEHVYYRTSRRCESLQ